MNRHLLAFLCIGCTCSLFAQGDNRLDQVLARAQALRGERSSFKDIVAELGAMVRGADQQKVIGLAENLRRALADLAFLEGFAERGARGYIELPIEILRALQDTPADLDLAEREEEKVRSLRQRFELERNKSLRRREQEKRPAEVSEVARGSQGAAAALAVDLDLPTPPREEVTATPMVRAGADHRGEGRALFLNGDWSGALIAFERIPDSERGADVLYRMARCHDMLQQWEAAKKGYELVMEREPNGTWHDSAKFQLDLLKKRERVRKVIEDKKERP